MLKFSWDAQSAAWIATLEHRMTNSLRSGAVQALKSGLADALRSARSSIRKFEGDAEQALGLFGLRITRSKVSMSLGFTGMKVFVPEIDVADKSLVPFNYAWAKESQYAAKTHRVWLYNPRTGQSTSHRAKLVRWLKKQGGNWSVLPDAPTVETWNKKGDVENFPPPFVNVHPSMTATAYINELIADGGDPLASMILDSPALDDAIRRGWSS